MGKTIGVEPSKPKAQKIYRYEAIKTDKKNYGKRKKKREKERKCTQNQQKQPNENSPPEGGQTNYKWEVFGAGRTETKRAMGFGTKSQRTFWFGGFLDIFRLQNNGGKKKYRDKRGGRESQGDPKKKKPNQPNWKA